ncbi:huntingtin isoform X2 [Drosophila kikkawai]|uniref:Huntingtin isoform X2 n=1 Tax=Drosophila kikkawai TaxID=30033 RepID=A0ABM4GLP9_DROKI
MDKSRSSAYDRFVSFVDQLRNTECSQKQKITCFQQIAECIMSPSLASHINYPAHCGTATNVLLLFCEDLDSVVRMSAEENLNRIFRALEKTRVSRILMDLYGEIKRNGNQRSLRICLNLFSYYAPQIKEKHIKWYAVRLLQCMSTISQRKETLLQETLCDFVKHFGRYVQQGLSDSESCKLFEIFLDNIGADCAVKRRCSAQNCISLIEYARNRSLMARHGLGKVMELLLTDQQTSSVLGALGLLRLLLPQLIRGYSAASQEDSESLAGQQQQQQPKHQKRQQQQQQTTTSDCRQIIEIYDYCLHLLSTQHTTNHAIINATLEVINGILQALDAPSDGQYQGHSLGQSLRQLLCNQQLQHNEYLRRRKSLKNQIFQLKNYEVATSQQPVQDELADGDEDADGDGATAMQMKKNSNAKLQQPKCQQQRQQQQLEVDSSSLGINAGEDATTEAASSVADEGAKAQRGHIRNAARSISECVASVEERQGDDDDMDDDDDDMELLSAECDDFTTLSQLNEQQRSLSAALQLPATTAATTGDKLIDVDADVGGLPKPQHQSSLQNLLAGSEDKSQHLSDIDNESFNSIDFEAEITIAGSGGSGREQQQQQTEQTHPTADGSGESEPGDATAIGTFFNNLLSHSNAASESVSKLFRQSGGSKSTPSKSAHADKSDAVSTASLTLSLSSLASSNMEPPERQPSIAETPTPVEDSLSATASHTASTALMMDAPAEEAGGKEGLGPGMDYSKPETPQMRSTPNANPFLVENSPLRQTVVGRALISVKIGSIMEQSLVYYTARLVAARFLLSGQAAGLQPDSVCRVSIKSLSLAVIAQCVRLAPRVLQLTVEISDQELQLLEQTSCHTESGDSTQVSSPQSSDNSQVGGEKQRVDSPLMQTEVEDNLLLLDIKDDHFGASTCPAYLQQPAPTLTRSADASVLLLGESSASQPAKNSAKEDKLSKSEIIGSSFRPTVAVEDVPPLSLPPRPPKRTKSTRSRTGINGVMSTAGSSQTPICQALSDVLLYHDHCDPILRGGVQQVVGFFLQSSGAGLYLELQRGLGLQHLLAVLLKGFEDEIHTVVIQALNAFDKIFPHVVSKYLTEPPCHYHAHQQQKQKQQEQQQDDQDLQRHSSGQQKRPGQAQTFGQQTFAKDQDNALSSQRPQQKRPNDAGTCAKSSATDNDELLAALLNDFQLQSTGMQQQQQQQQKNNGNGSGQLGNEPEPFCVFAISPKLLLSKLRLCHHNKYWLVQNKYAEVISNLNYVLLRSYYANFRCGLDSNNTSAEPEEQQSHSTKEASDSGCGRLESEDIVCTYEAQFLAELLHLLGDDDARVREHAACCLCRFIMQTARQEQLATDWDEDEGCEIEGNGNGNGNVNVETQQTNFNLLWDFFDYRIFGSMSVTLRNLFRASSTIVPPLAELDALPSTASACPEAGITSMMGSSSSCPLGSAAEAAAFAASAYFDGSYGTGIAEGHVFALAGQRQIALEEKVLAKVLYRLTNKLMTLNDKNLQFGIIYALRLLLRHFNFVDYQQAWVEFNFVEICISHAYYNNATAADLSCQNDLIDVMGKLMAGAMLSSGEPRTPHLDFLLRHSLKMLNIYYHLVTNQRPPSGSHSASSKAPKSELFAREQPGAAALQALGYFAGDYVYMKLYNILRGANDSYKITINHEAGSLLICLLKTCLNALSLCLEFLPSASPPELKLIEEILHYLTKLINYAPAECVACLRQLLKYLFAQNYASQVRVQPSATGGHHAAFTRPYFVAKGRGHGAVSTLLPTINSKPEHGAGGGAARQPIDTAPLQALGMLFVRGLQPPTPPAGECARLIKLFEPLVIYCLTLFMKSNALIQAPILRLLSQLLELNVTYSILDSKNVIFEQILNNMELIEGGIDRNAFIIVPPMLRFLVQLTHKSDRQLITIPKIISITNNLLASSSVREVALLALRTLSYELFFMHSQLEEALDTDSGHNSGRTACQSPLSAAPTPETREALLAQRRELDTQREVVLGMLEKFIEARPSQQVLALLLLFERSVEQLEEAPYRSAQDADTVYGILCRGLCSRQWRLHSGGDLRLLESCFRNNGNHVLADSKGFLQLLQLFIEQSVGNFGDLALAMVILANVILKTEEIYLVNHIKLYLKNNPTAERRLQALLPATSATPPSWQDEAPSTSSAAAAARAAAAAASSSTGRAAISEINYFAKVLSEKLLACLDALLGGATSSDSTALDHAYCLLAGRFVDALNNVCCRSRHKDALQSVFRLVLAESEFLCKYYSLLLMSAAGQGGSGSLDALLLACMRLTLAMRLEEPVVLLGQAAQLPLKRNLQRALLREVCGANVGCDWSAQQVRRLFDGRYLNFLIADHLEFLCELCQERPECGSLLQVALLQNAHRLSRQSIRIVLRLLGRLCESAEQNASGDAGGDAGPVLQALQLLSRLHQLHDGQRSLQLPMERMARRLTAQSGPVARNDIYERLVEGDLAGGEDQDALRTLLLKDLECRQDNETATPSRIIDESWLFAELIRFATQHADAPQQQKQLMLLLLEIQSEPKLNRLLRSLGAEQEARLLRHAIAGSLTAMLSDFQQKCIQHAPHINYMQPPPLARVSCSLLLAKVVSITASESRAPPTVVQLDVARAVATLMACIRNVEKKALIYIDARLMEKFVGEHLLRQEHLPPLMAYLGWLAGAAKQILAKPTRQDSEQDALGVLLATVDALLLQPPVWRELNACSDAGLRCELLELLGSVARCILQDTIFYQRHRLDRGGSAFKGPAPQAIFLAKLIETQIDIESLDNCRVLAGGEDARLQFVGQELAQVQVPLSLVASIGTSLLRTHHFYAYAVTPPELIQQQPEEQLQQQKQQADGKLPTIPVDSLSDVDILRQFVKRLSILGFTTRQQFEEYFMTCLLLINQLYDEHMVDQQEQFQIKQVCLQAILELLMTYKTFPIVGQANGQFHHTTRWQRITCDSISLKKLHKVQLLVDACSVFYQPNLERQLAHDNVIGTRTFAANQYDLNFSWAQMEAHAGGGMGTGEEAASDIKQSCDSDVPDMAMRNYRHFTQLSGIDFRSSTQLVFDVLQQMIELNHMLVLPNLVKFCEICESRDHIKWIKERCLKLQEQVAMDDTISHQHIIYLLCRSQALLIPSLGELQALCSLIGNVYLKSTHGFIRIATLQGLLCLLECCSKTNTTMGRMSEELTLLRALIVGYINRHGIIDESPLQFSVEHTKLVWTLNYSLIEWTSKFVPQCHLLSNAVIAASNLLKTTADEELYLCVLHGLERMVVNSRVPSRGAQPTGREAAVAGAGIGVGAAAGAEAGVGVVVTPQMRHKIEKLALELLKMENEKFSIPALKLLLSCMYVGSAAQLENTELSNGIVQDDPEIIAQQNDKVDILLHCIKSSTRDAAWIYGQVLCQIIRDLVPPNEILTKVIKEFLAINQPHGDVIAMIVYQAAVRGSE